MNLSRLNEHQFNVLERIDSDNRVILIKETDKYRWLEFGGCSIQSVMHRHLQQQPISPVCESLLLFVLWKQGPIKLLNLGLGGASIERALMPLSNISITAVESSSLIIKMAQRYFYLPKKVNVICQKAESFIMQTKNQYNIILCDLFIADKSSDCIFKHNFYRHLANISSKDVVVFINLKADSEQHLLSSMLAIKNHFQHIALIEFDDYANIVIICSNKPIPERSLLQQKFNAFDSLRFNHLDKIINNIRYIL